MAPKVKVIRQDYSGDFLARIKGIGNRVVYVGIPADSPRQRSEQIKKRAGKFSSIRKSRKKTAARLKQIASTVSIGNAQALYLFSKGSPRKGIPPRPVLEPAILAPGNKEKIAGLVALSANAYAQNKVYLSKQLLKRAGVAAKKACYDWFTDSRNKWAPNSQRTIVQKGSDLPGIDTTAMRNAITYVEKDVS